jgi:uncharacterized protein
MAAKPWNPLRLDLPSFAREGAHLSGEWAAADLPRFADGATPASDWPAVRWALQGECRERLGAEPALWVRLQLQAQASLTCQRCLKPAALPLSVDRWFHFVRDEEQAAELDVDSEEDVLVASPRFDCREWAEDELLLELPLVPMHDTCPEPLRLVAEQELAEAPAKNPFAALAALKRHSGTGSA